ncbi:helix-turn-helix domain containing protein [Specibacter cremeus]|uniref:helix-turn-helix domain containing protein n=1 Tax=Specibacter cremeus TaxID=1629051 RepID=UPI000F76C106|nr:helix-turn-helix domain containing protein [Specibacter cremeus]
MHRWLVDRSESDSRPKRIYKPSRVLRQITAAIAQDIVNGYRESKTVYELAAQYHCHRTTVSDVRKRNGITLRRTPATNDQIQEMIGLYESGLSLARVGERFGIHASTVLNHLRSRGVPTRESHGRS